MRRLLAQSIIDPDLGFHYAHIHYKKLTPVPHCHDFFEIFFTFEDNVLHVVNGEEQILIENSLVFIRPDDVHCYDVSAMGKCEIMNIAFTRQIFEPLIEGGASHFLRYLLERKMPPTIQLMPYELVALKNRIQTLTLSAIPDKFLIQLEFKALLIDIIVHYLYKSLSDLDSYIPSWLSELAVSMQQKENFIAGLPRLLELSGKTQEHVNRSIKKHYGVTTTEWLNSFKLYYAANLLQYTQDEIIDIAEK